MVADIFESESAASASQQSEKLAAEMELLESLDNEGETYAADIQQIDARIDQTFTELLCSIRDQDASGLSSGREELTHQFNQRQIATGTSVDYTTRLRALQNEKAALDKEASAIMGQVTAPESGYFSSVIDGWENVFDYDDVLGLTVADLQAEYSPEEVPENAVGKISEEFLWYFACTVDATTALKLKQTEEVQISHAFCDHRKNLCPCSGCEPGNPKQ